VERSSVHTATTYCNTLQHTSYFDMDRAFVHTAAHCTTLQHIAPHCTLQHTASHCNTLQHATAHCKRTVTQCRQTATHCKQTATHCHNTQQPTETYYNNTLQLTATHLAFRRGGGVGAHCNNILQPHAHCNTPRISAYNTPQQPTATHCNITL